MLQKTHTSFKATEGAAMGSVEEDSDVVCCSKRLVRESI